MIGFLSISKSYQQIQATIKKEIPLLQTTINKTKSGYNKTIANKKLIANTNILLIYSHLK